MGSTAPLRAPHCHFALLHPMRGLGPTRRLGPMLPPGGLRSLCAGGRALVCAGSALLR